MRIIVLRQWKRKQLKPVNFEVIKEKWNEYSLKDGSTLKTRIILRSIFSETVGDKKEMKIDCQLGTLVFSPSLMGPPDMTVRTVEELNNNIEIRDCPYETFSYEVNEYRLDDASTLLINTNLTNIARTKLYDKDGTRIYIVETAGQMTVKPFKAN